jgi:hypothetical protein
MNRITRTLAASLGVGIASLSLAGVASADTLDGFNTGSVDGQHGWLASGNYDHGIVDVKGDMKFRASNARTSGSFGDMPFSQPTAMAGEGQEFNTLTNEFTIQSATGAPQPGLSMSVSPTGEGGSRMSYLRFEDRFDGIRVFFNDATFTDKWVATLDRDSAHSVKFVTQFVPGNDNDVVRVSIDDSKVCGTSWENYYRFGEQRNPAGTDRLMWRLGGTAALSTEGKGFLFDDVTSTSSNTTATPCPLPVGPQGPAGQNGVDGKDGSNGSNGRNGVDGNNGANVLNASNGKDGATTIIRESAGSNKLVGASLRKLTVPTMKGGKLVSVKATLRGKKLPVKGIKISANLTGMSVGNYNVSIVAKFKKHGKTHTVRQTRSLSITLAA